MSAPLLRLLNAHSGLPTYKGHIGTMNTRHPLVIPVPVNKAQQTVFALSQQSILTDLQFSRCYFEHQLHHRADGQTSRAGRVDLVPNGVAVHLRKQKHTLLFTSCSYRELKYATLLFSICFGIFGGVVYSTPCATATVKVRRRTFEII